MPKKQRNAEKCRENKENAEKHREMQRTYRINADIIARKPRSDKYRDNTNNTEKSRDITDTSRIAYRELQR